ncbi:MAG: hypothetical protein ABL883_08285 [Terricaulis sp.]
MTAYGDEREVASRGGERLIWMASAALLRRSEPGKLAPIYRSHAGVHSVRLLLVLRRRQYVIAHLREEDAHIDRIGDVARQRPGERAVGAFLMLREPLMRRIERENGLSRQASSTTIRSPLAPSMVASTLSRSIAAT